MLEAGVIGALVLGEMLGYRRAVFGRPPSRPQRLLPSAAVSLTIHIGFHAAATVAPSPSTAIAFVLAGWTTFIFWWKWVARAPDPWNFGEGDDDGSGPGGGGPGGSGPEDDGGTPGGGGHEVDWDALEREMSEYLDSGHDREPERPLVGTG